MKAKFQAHGARAVGAVLLAAAGTISATTVDAHAAPRPGHHRTVRNVLPHPDFYTVCVVKGYNSLPCISQELAAIQHARSQQPGHPRRMVLPGNFRNLNVARRTIVVTNLERVDRGLRPVEGLSPALNHRAQIGANGRLDPVVSVPLMRSLGISVWGSIWAGSLGPLAADYNLMYYDGYDATTGINIDCATPRAAGCWGHRRNILGTYYGEPTLLGGVGNMKTAWDSTAQVIAGSTSSSPHLTYTWKRALAHGADRRHTHRLHHGHR
jgi:hypothetical protein